MVNFHFCSELHYDYEITCRCVYCYILLAFSFHGNDDAESVQKGNMSVIYYSCLYWAYFRPLLHYSDTSNSYSSLCSALVSFSLTLFSFSFTLA